MTNKLITFNSSIRNRILVAFLFIIVTGSIILNFMLHASLSLSLLKEGWDERIVEHIDRHLLDFGILITFATILVLLVIALFLSKTITRPFNKLTHGMRDIADSRWSTRIEVGKYDETIQLAKGFNFMAMNIEKTLQDLESSNEYIENILSSLPSVLIVVSNRLNVMSNNAAFNKLKNRYPTLSLTSFTERLEEEMIRNLDTGERMSKELIVIPEGSKARIIFSAVITRIKEISSLEIEERPSVLLTLTDITEQRMMKELITQSRQDWEDTFNTIPDIVTIHDGDYNIIQANMAAKKVLNLPFLDPHKTEKCYKYYHGTDNTPEACPNCECYSSSEPSTFEIFEPHLNKYLEIRSIPRVNDGKDVVGLIHIARDITQRKKIEDERNLLNEAIKKAKIEWELTFDSATEFILLIDKDLRITRCNRCFSDFLNKPVHDIVGRKCTDFFPAAYGDVDDIKKRYDESGEFLTNAEVQTSSGRWLYLNHQPIQDIKSRTLHSVLIATDITELKKAQQKNKESSYELKNKVEDLEKFYDMAVGRELRMKELKKEIKKLHLKLANHKDKALC